VGLLRTCLNATRHLFWIRFCILDLFLRHSEMMSDFMDDGISDVKFRFYKVFGYPKQGILKIVILSGSVGPMP